jgi:hypothetical protein
MATRTRFGARNVDDERLDLPPPFRLVRLREVGDAFAHACAHAAELGAGTLVFVGRFDMAEFAVVMEPDEPLPSARLAFYAGMVALCDALAALAPPEKPITIEWPDAIRIDGGLVGGGRLAWPRRADQGAAPEWLVFGSMVRTVTMNGTESGLHPLSTALEEEGFGGAGSGRILEGFARHLMVAVDGWREGGAGAIVKSYVAKMELDNDTRWNIEQNGDLLISRPGKQIERRTLLSALKKQPSWLDPETAGPRL